MSSTSVTFDESVCSNGTYQSLESSVDSCLECEEVQQVRLEAEIRSLISLREEMNRREENVAALEAQLLDTKSQLKKHDLSCPACGQIKDPRQRKQIILQEIYREFLNDKPKKLLCTFGLFKRLEDLINQGLMDLPSIPVEYLRCRKCRQVVESCEAKTLLVCDLTEVLGEEQTTSGCSAHGVCGECLAHVRRFLACPRPEPGNTTPSDPDGGLVPTREPNETAVKELLNDGEKSTEINKKLQDQLEENRALASKVEALESQISHLQNKIEGENSLHKDLNDKMKQWENKFLISMSLTEFRGEFWEDAKLILLSWERELEAFQIPRSKWTLFVSKILKGEAKDWCSFYFKSSEISWEKFSRQFLYHFDNKDRLHNYINKIIQKLKKGDSCFKASEKYQFFKLFSKLNGYNPMTIISLVNDSVRFLDDRSLRCNNFDSFHSILEITQTGSPDARFWCELFEQLVNIVGY